MKFTKETPILYYDPRSSQRWSQREYILFPVYYYRVVAPRSSHRNLNILEKAILGIAQIGAFTAEEIGEKLDVGLDLASLIISELQNQSLIDNHGLITEKGKKTLNQETFDTEDLVVGYIFQEPWNGELLPRFMENLAYVETRFNQDGFPELILGTTGKPFYQRVFMPLPVNNTLAVQPSPQDIIKAVKNHNFALENYQKNNRQLTLELTEEDDFIFERKTNLQRISFIEDKPTPVWLATFIYVPEINFDDLIDIKDNWRICDPFGLGDSDWLYKRINKLLKNQDKFPLQKSITDLTKQLTNSKVTNKTTEYQELMSMLHEEAIKKVEDKLSIDITKWQNLYNSLIAMERSNLEIEMSDDSKSLLKDKIDDILVKAQIVLENLLLSISEKYSIQDCLTLLDSKDKQYNKIILDQVAQKIGFNIPLPQSLLSVDFNRIRSASVNKGSLRSYLLATLLTAYNEEKHPFYNFAQTMPDFLVKLDQLANLRNQSGHYSEQKLDYNLVSKQIDLVYQIVNLFLNTFEQTQQTIDLQE